MSVLFVVVVRSSLEGLFQSCGKKRARFFKSLMVDFGAKTPHKIAREIINGE